MAYQGHRNRNHWNVALWIGNDEALYRVALDYIRQYRTKDRAARAMLEALQASGVTHTPDGARYTITAIRAAMVEM